MKRPTNLIWSGMILSLESMLPNGAALSINRHQAASSPTQPHQILPSSSTSPQPSDTRRRFVVATSAWILAATGASPPSLAVKEKNEALCGTGFFTNIAQYMCTEIGDISDEGKSREMKNDEVKSIDSLMSKFGNIDVVDETKTSSKKDKLAATVVDGGRKLEVTAK